MTVKKVLATLLLILGCATPGLAQFNSVCGPPTVCVSPDTLTFAHLNTPVLNVTSSASIANPTFTGPTIFSSAVRIDALLTLGLGLSVNTGNVTFSHALTVGTYIAAPTIGPSAAQQHTLPAVASDTFALLAAAQTFTNKSISGSSNTITNIGNGSLTNSSVTVTAGTGMSGGGSVALGASITLTNAGVTSATGTANQVAVSGATGDVIFSLAGPYLPTTYTTNGVLYGNSTSSIAATAAGSAGQLLRAGPTPGWTTATYPSTAGTSGNALVSDGTNLVSTAIVNSLAGTSNQVTVSGATGAITISLPQNINTTASMSLTKLTLGATSGTTGSIDLKGSTAGTVTVTMVNSSNTYTFTLPPNAGTSGYVLSTDGSGVTSWVANGSGSSVTSVIGTANQIAVSSATGDVTFSLVGPYTPATYTTNGILYGNGTSSIGVTAQGASGTVLHGNAGTPTFAAVSLTVDVSGVLPLANGGTNANLTASNGGIFYSTATAAAILAGTSTAGQILRSGATAAPTWSTATYPATAGTSGNALVSDGTNLVSTAIVNSITGTANQVVASGSTGTITLSLPQSIATTSSPSFTKITYGALSGTTGSIDFKGSTAGTITLTMVNSSNTYTFTLPPNAGTSGYVLSTDGSGVTSWVANGAGGGVTSAIGTSNQINVSGATGAVTFSISSTLVVPGTLAITGLTSSNSTTDSASSTSGSFTIAGGLGVAKKLFVGTLLDAPIGQFGITTATSSGTSGFLYVGSNANAQLILDTATESPGNSSQFVCREARGTMASLGNNVANDRVCSILMQGRLSGVYVSEAQITASVASSTAGIMGFWIRRGSTLTQSMTLDSGPNLNLDTGGGYYVGGVGGMSGDCGPTDTCHFVGGILTGIN